MRRLLTSCASLLVGLSGVNVHAEERRLQVTVEAPLSSEPTQLCIVSYFVPAPDESSDKLDNSARFSTPVTGSCEWSESQTSKCKLEDYEPQLASNGLCAPVRDFEVPAGEYVWCEPKLNQSERVLALHVDSGVKRASLTHSLVQLVLQTTSSTRKNTVTISAVGGDYLGTAVASHRDPDGSDRAILPVVPRCARSHVTIPRYECPDGKKNPVLKLVSPKRELSIAFDKLRDSLDLPLPQSEERGGSLELSDCWGKLNLYASWLGQPPPQIALKPRVFPVSWRKDPLSAATCPKELSLPEVPMVCAGQRSVEQPSADQATCQYECNSASPIDLPTAVAFKEARPALTADAGEPSYNHWESRLLQPGERLEGYLRPEQRFITLTRKGWAKDREKRLGDRITSISISTPDGKEQNVATSTPRLFVPGVSAGDNVTYRYIGDRPFESQLAPVESGGIVRLGDPDNGYMRGVQPGVALWGGWRNISGAKGAATWNPVGGVELVFAVPAWRAYLFSEGAYLEPEVHFGASVTTQAYESSFQATPVDARAESSHNVMILVVPIEVTLRGAPATEQLQLDVGGGIAWYRAFYAGDTNRLSPSFGFSFPRATLLWRVTRAFTLGFDMRVLWGIDGTGLHTRRVVESFDFAGLVRREEPDTTITMFGPILRFDDVF